MNIHEMYGRLAERYEDECARHLGTVDLLRKVRGGEIPIENVAITEDNRWAILPVGLVIPGKGTPEEASDGDCNEASSAA